MLTTILLMTSCLLGAREPVTAVRVPVCCETLAPAASYHVVTFDADAPASSLEQFQDQNQDGINSVGRFSDGRWQYVLDLDYTPDLSGIPEGDYEDEVVRT